LQHPRLTHKPTPSFPLLRKPGSKKPFEPGAT